MTRKRAHSFGRLSVFAFIVAVFTFVVSLGTVDAAASAPLFLPAVSYYPGGAYAASVAVADLNGDGKPDLVVANEFSNSVGVLLGNGDGTFQPAVSYSSGGLFAEAVAVADVNGDGKPDLLVAIRCVDSSDCTGSVGVLLGNGDGTFQPAVSYVTGGVSAWSVAVADVNGDGKPDLVVANIDSNTVGVLLGNGDGTFQPGVSYYSGGYSPFSVAVADVNADGKMDLLVADPCLALDVHLQCVGESGVGVLLGNGDGTFQPVVTYSSGANSANSVAVGDVNGDGKPDLLVLNACTIIPGNSFCFSIGTVGVLLGNGDGTFQPAVTYAAGGAGVGSVAVADVNGDGKLDLLVTNDCTITVGGFCASIGTVGVLLGNGDGTFQTAVTYGSGGAEPKSIAIADVDGDGKPDLVVANYCDATLFNCERAAVGLLLTNRHPPDRIPPAITLSATPKILWPPNGRLVPVTLSGTITDTNSGVNASTAEYAVQDEYGEVQPFGQITLDSAGNYSFTILLRAGRRANDLNGRQYTIRVSARDNAGNRGVRWARVTVPHSQGH